jgi:threonine/homoserine/homoserine lactone efflux protein
VALGIDVGCFVWGALVAFGLGALLAVSEMAYTVLKWCGAAYLCWLGLQLLLRPRQHFTLQSDVDVRSSNGFLRGMLGNVLNPKMGVFYVSFLPQFIPVGHSPMVWTFLLVSIHVFLGTLWSLTLILASRYASNVLRKPAVVKWMDRITGMAFLLFAARLALSKR